MNSADHSSEDILSQELSPLYYQLSKRQKAGTEILVFLSTITVAMGQTIVFTVIQPVGRELGLNALEVGIIIVGSSIIFATGNNIWGRQSERWGRKAIILLGLLGYTFGTILFTSVFYFGFEGILTGTALIVALTAARMIQSTLMSATPPAASALIADITDTTTRTAAMARVGTAHSLGTILGPASAGFLVAFAMLAPLYLAAVMPLVAAFMCWIWLPKAPKKEGKGPITVAKLSYFDKRVRKYIFIGISMFVAFAATQMTLGFYVQDTMGLNATETVKLMGKLSVISALTSVTMQWTLANWFRWSPMSLIRLGLPLITLGVSAILFANSFWIFALAMGLIGGGMGIVGPGYSAAASMEVSPKEQGAVAGLITSCAPIGFIVGPIIGPGLYHFGAQLPYMFTLSIMLMLSTYVLFIMRSSKKEGKHV